MTIKIEEINRTKNGQIKVKIGVIQQPLKIGQATRSHLINMIKTQNKVTLIKTMIEKEMIVLKIVEIKMGKETTEIVMIIMIIGIIETIHGGVPIKEMTTNNKMGVEKEMMTMTITGNLHKDQRNILGEPKIRRFFYVMKVRILEIR